MAGMISQKCYYAIKALFDLAQRRGANPQKIGSVAERQDIPIRFLEVILRQLKQAGFVESKRGAQGGYFLARKSSRIKLIDVITFFDADFAQFGATPKTVRESGGDVDSVLSLVWKESRGALVGALEKWTVADLVEKAEAEKSQFSNFSI